MDYSSFKEYSTSIDLRMLADHCDELAAGREMPLRGDLRPNKLGWIIARLYLVDVIEDGRDYLLRLVGSYIDEIYGFKLVGRRLGEVKHASLTGTLRANLDQVLSTRKPYYQRGELCWPEDRRIAVERLLVPFAGENGEIVTILGAMDCEVPEELLLLSRGKGEAEYEPMPSRI